MKGRESSFKGKKHTDEARKKMSEATNHHGENNPFFGKTHSIETIEQIRKANLGKKDSDETRRKKSESKKGSKNSMYGVKKETKQCPHCSRIIDVANYVRWHGDNCKSIS